MPTLFIQIRVFLATLMIGILAGLILNYYQSTVKAAGVGRLCICLLDLLLWIIMIVLVFSSMLLINHGEMRVYVLIAFLTGILLYYQYAPPRVKQSVQKAARITVAAGVACQNGIKKACRPLVRILRGLWSRIADKHEEDDDPEIKE